MTPQELAALNSIITTVTTMAETLDEVTLKMAEIFERLYALEQRPTTKEYIQ